MSDRTDQNKLDLEKILQVDPFYYSSFDRKGIMGHIREKISSQGREIIFIQDQINSEPAGTMTTWVVSVPLGTAETAEGGWNFSSQAELVTISVQVTSEGMDTILATCERVGMLDDQGNPSVEALLVAIANQEVQIINLAE